MQKHIIPYVGGVHYMVHHTNLDVLSSNLEWFEFGIQEQILALVYIQLFCS
jgi:hypothetical protein